MRDDPPPPRPATSNRHKLLAVQVLRGLAALSVVVHHAGYDADTLALRFGLAPLGIDRVFDWTFGIHLFFVISGFIMVRTARGFGQRGAVLSFLGRRLTRVAPLYWLLTSIVIMGAFSAPGLLNVPIDGWGLMVGSYLFLPVTRINGEIRPVLGQGWTLDFEMFFYLLFGAAMIFPRRLGLGLLALTLMGLAAAGKIFHPESPALIVWTSGLLLEFLTGIGIGLAIDAGLRLSAWVAVVLGIGGLLLAVGLGPAVGLTAQLDTVIAAGVPAAMILAACTWGPAWPHRPLILAFAALGDVSYSLYLTHPFTIRLLRVGWATAIGTATPLVLFPIVASLAAIGVSFAVFRWVERPMTEALHGRFPLTGGRPAPHGSTPSGSGR